jgi:hypothetical protein
LLLGALLKRLFLAFFYVRNTGMLLAFGTILVGALPELGVLLKVLLLDLSV